MAKPVPSPSQQAAIEQEVAQQTNQQNALTESAGLQDAEIARKTEVDNAFKDLFNWYNNDVIGKYDAEKKAINGVFVTSPVVEADITSVAANPPSGRLVPTPPATDIVRITEFDGGGTSIAANYEQKHIADQALVEGYLQTGYPPSSGFNPATAETDASLSGVSTTLKVTDATNPLTIAVNDIIVIEGTSEVAVVKITSVTDDMGGDPPYNFTYGIVFLVAPTGTIASGAELTNFSGFTNAERTAKTATDPVYQNLMDALIDQLEGFINSRLARLTEQLTALNTNQDPDGVADIATAVSDATSNQTFLTNYLVTTDISNTGLASLSSDRASRSAFLTTRLTQITNAYTMQTENYYDARYSTANNRGNTQRGTLRAKSNSQSTKDVMLSLASSLGDSINTLNGILP